MSLACIVSSPFQLICIKEYLCKYPTKNPIIIVLIYNEIEKKQLINLSKELDLKFNFLIQGKKILQYLILFKLKIKLGNIDKFIIGNYFSDPHIFLYNILKPKKCCLVDDGLNSFRVMDSILEGQKNNLSFFKNLFKKQFQYPEKLKFFTIFDFKKTKMKFNIDHNDFKYLSGKIVKFKRSDSTYIIGQPFVELDILLFKDYILGLEKITNNNVKTIYIPSRKESDKNLAKIKNHLKITILNTDLNIENYLIKNKIIPKKIVGFTSSALVSLNRIFNSKKNNIGIKSYRPNKMINSTLNNYSFDQFYNFLKNNNIQITEYD